MKLIEKLKTIYGALTFLERVVVALISVALLVLHLNYTPWLTAGKIVELPSSGGVVSQSARILVFNHPTKPGSYTATELVVTCIVFFGLWAVLALIIYRGGKRNK